jgi:hypothetical protein
LCDPLVMKDLLVIYLLFSLLVVLECVANSSPPPCWTYTYINCVCVSIQTLYYKHPTYIIIIIIICSVGTRCYNVSNYPKKGNPSCTHTSRKISSVCVQLCPPQRNNPPTTKQVLYYIFLACALFVRLSYGRHHNNQSINHIQQHQQQLPIFFKSLTLPGYIYSLFFRQFTRTRTRTSRQITPPTKNYIFFSFKSPHQQRHNFPVLEPHNFPMYTVRAAAGYGTLTALPSISFSF